MLETRVIPVLLIQNGDLVKGQQFTDHKYIGDPINTVKIFNEKEVDEIFILDISANNEKNDIDFGKIAEITNEAFMPLGYGGGVKTMQQIEKLFFLGMEKIIVNSSAFFNPDLIKEAVKICGSQSIVVSVDVKKNNNYYEVFVNNGKYNTQLDPITYVKKMQEYGVGELFVTSIDREGTGTGFDLDLFKSIVDAVDIPVVGMGGARFLQDLIDAKKKTNISALAAGNIFFFYGEHKAVLITYPKRSELKKLFI